ncbi:MAG: response regulator [Cytophagales bacterium]|nr:response regulator [Cytophagales bacterium]
MIAYSEAIEDYILVVDDDAAIRKLIGKILHRQGFSYANAASVSEAKKLLAAKSFALLLNDICMPGESGLDLVAHVKSYYKDTSVIIVTTLTDMGIARRLLEMDIYEYIVKPVKRSQLVISVANALRRRELELKEKACKKNLEQKVLDLTNRLQKTVDRLSVREKELEELNSALQVLLKKRENDRSSIEENVMSNVQKLILPSVQRMKANARQSERFQLDLRLIESGLNELVSPFAKNIASNYFKLTPNEVKVAALIKQGMRTKEIARNLNLSVNTIMTHRYNIRSKLGIKNKNQNLQVYLNNL